MLLQRVKVRSWLVFTLYAEFMYCSLTFILSAMRVKACIPWSTCMSLITYVVTLRGDVQS